MAKRKALPACIQSAIYYELQGKPLPSAFVQPLRCVVGCGRSCGAIYQCYIREAFTKALSHNFNSKSKSLIFVLLSARNASDATLLSDELIHASSFQHNQLLQTMSPYPKKPKVIDPGASVAVAVAELEADRIAKHPNSNADIGIGNDPTINGMSNNITAKILGFLGYKDIMRSRICCKKFRDAARNTIVPWVDDERKRSYSYSYSNSLPRSYWETRFCVSSVQKHKAMVAISSALPNLQQIIISNIGYTGHKYSDGEDPDERRAAQTANWTILDIEIISNFSKLRSLEISGAPLNGRYPSLLNFPLLQKLVVMNCPTLKLDMAMLAGLPSLKELEVGRLESSTGNINSLSALKVTLEKLNFSHCGKIEGDIMDLADFPRLKSVKLSDCSEVTGDVREIGEHDFPKLEELKLGAGVIGSSYHEFQVASDVPSVVEAIYRLRQREPSLIPNLGSLHWKLSRDSPEWYDSSDEHGHPPPPFCIDLFQVGSRVGWRWKTEYRYNRGSNSCEINWLDPEPARESSDYDVYIRELQSVQEDIFCFEGYHQPPTEAEYKRLCEEYYGI